YNSDNDYPKKFKIKGFYKVRFIRVFQLEKIILI
ncbi:uncharacterized protein METZ01_LOCUS353347, partial [marine metagenome]